MPVWVQYTCVKASHAVDAVGRMSKMMRENMVQDKIGFSVVKLFP